MLLYLIGLRSGFEKELPRCVAVLMVMLMPFQLGVVVAQEAELSDHFSMVLQPPATGLAIEESEVDQIVEFFHKAERAIESKNIDALMSLYSERYTNLRNGDKKFAEKIWNRIFASFDDISSRHSMQLISYDQTSGQAITECSGLLVGTPKGTDSPTSIDRWDAQRHILVKDGDWKLFGNAGKAAERYGEESGEMHPLF